MGNFQNCLKEILFLMYSNTTFKYSIFLYLKNRSINVITSITVSTLSIIDYHQIKPTVCKCSKFRIWINVRLIRITVHIGQILRDFMNAAVHTVVYISLTSKQSIKIEYIKISSKLGNKSVLKGVNIPEAHGEWLWIPMAIGQYCSVRIAVRFYVASGEYPIEYY